MKKVFEVIFGHLGDLYEDLKFAIYGLSQGALNWTPHPGMNSIGIPIFHLSGIE
jgi:hypothetical protein